MIEKKINSRIILKHDVEANWSKATFIPSAGEIVIYDIDDNYEYERLKIGDGVSQIGELPFVNEALRTELIEQINLVDNKVTQVSTLVGDTPVSQQITSAINGLAAQVAYIDVEDRITLNI